MVVDFDKDLGEIKILDKKAGKPDKPDKKKPKEEESK